MVDWQDGLSFYSFMYKVIYRKGEQNNADALSRLTREAQKQPGASNIPNTTRVCTLSTEGIKLESVVTNIDILMTH